MPIDDCRIPILPFAPNYTEPTSACFDADVEAASVNLIFHVVEVNFSLPKYSFGVFMNLNGIIAEKAKQFLIEKNIEAGELPIPSKQLQDEFLKWLKVDNVSLPQPSRRMVHEAFSRSLVSHRKSSGLVYFISQTNNELKGTANGK